MKRVELLLDDPDYSKYMEYNVRRDIMQQNYCSYSFQHHLDVARIAYILILEQSKLNYFGKEYALEDKPAAKEMIYAAGLLHDVGIWKQYEEGVDHAAFSAKLARDILSRSLFNLHEIDLICQAIYEHENISNEMSFLGEILYRADNLSRVCVKCEHYFSCSKRMHEELAVSSFEY